MIIDSKNIHTHEIKTSAIFKLDHYPTKMTEKEFIDLQNLEDMVMIEGIHKRFCPSKPLFILTEEFESIIENCKIQDEGYEYEECYASAYWLDTNDRMRDQTWEVVLQVLRSLNSLKVKSMFREGSGSYVLYFWMRDGQVWRMDLQYEVNEERYINYNE